MKDEDCSEQEARGLPKGPCLSYPSWDTVATHLQFLNKWTFVPDKLDFLAQS